jgi:serine/threonine protein kinase
MTGGATEVSAEALERHARERIGTILSGKWRLQELVGVGGMASVYSATHRNGSRVAIKILHDHLANQDGVRLRFLQEGYAANRVGHPGAVSVRDDGETADGAAFLVMELLEGQTLEFKLRVAGPIAPSKALDYADQALDILAAAHERGIVHCDLKPDNIFVTTDGVVKVLDYGIATMADGSRRLTQPVGTLMGTPSFMPPEQAGARWDQVDARTDIWALGATLFNALSGRTVHDGDGPNEELARALTCAAPPLAEANPKVPDFVAAVVDRALAFNPNDRWPSARAMQEAVRGARTRLMPSSELPAADSYAQSRPLPPCEPDTLSESPMSAPSRRHTRPRRARMIALGGLALIVGALTVLIALLTTGSEPSVASAAGDTIPAKLEPSGGAAGVASPAEASRPRPASSLPAARGAPSAALLADRVTRSSASRSEASGSKSDRAGVTLSRPTRVGLASRAKAASRVSSGVTAKRATSKKTNTASVAPDDLLSRRK